jgi:hydrogenase maturation factor
MSTASQETYLEGVGTACKEVGVAIVAGHTGSYPGAGLTVIGGGTMLGFGRRKDCLDPSMSRKGDTILMTKGAAIEAAASLATAFPEYTARRAGRALARKAMSLVSSCSTVKDALTAVKVGVGAEGVTSMHDATEGGVLGGLEEMAAASGHSMRVDKGSILLTDEARAVCGAFRIDPLSSLSEGTLLITCDSRRVDELTATLARAGVRCAAIGRVGGGSGLWTRDGDGAFERATLGPDGYWQAYSRASSMGLR